MRENLCAYLLQQKPWCCVLRGPRKATALLITWLYGAKRLYNREISKQSIRKRYLYNSYFCFAYVINEKNHKFDLFSIFCIFGFFLTLWFFFPVTRFLVTSLLVTRYFVTLFSNTLSNGTREPKDVSFTFVQCLFIRIPLPFELIFFCINVTKYTD